MPLLLALADCVNGDAAVLPPALPWRRPSVTGKQVVAVLTSSVIVMEPWMPLMSRSTSRQRLYHCKRETVKMTSNVIAKHQVISSHAPLACTASAAARPATGFPVLTLSLLGMSIRRCE